MITHRYIDSKNIYVFEKDGVYWALSPEHVIEMHKVTKDLLDEVMREGAKEICNLPTCSINNINEKTRS